MKTVDEMLSVINVSFCLNEGFPSIWRCKNTVWFYGPIRMIYRGVYTSWGRSPFLVIWGFVWQNKM